MRVPYSSGVSIVTALKWRWNEVVLMALRRASSSTRIGSVVLADPAGRPGGAQRTGVDRVVLECVALWIGVSADAIRA
jgi:hypothetical protein